MIEAIEISNFQSHKYSLMEIDPGVNVIRGQSHKGKSSIIRALVWAILNKPRGDGFRSWFTRPRDSVEVAIQMNNGFISREKGKKNEYHFDGNDLAAVKSEVPTEVSQILQMDGINISSQFDPPFLLTDSPGDVARNFQNCVGLDIIDRVIKKIKQIARQNRSEAKRLTSAIEEREESIKNLSWLDKAGKDIELLHKKDIKRSENVGSKEALFFIMHEIKTSQVYIDEINQWLEIDSLVENLVSIIDSKRETVKLRNDLDYLIKEIKVQAHKINKLNQITTLEKQVNGCLDLEDRIHRRVLKRSKLINLCTDIGKTQKTARQATQDAQNLHKQFVDEMKLAGICPLCEQKYQRRIKVR